MILSTYETSGAKRELDAAERCRDTDPSEAVTCIRRAQQQLRAAGFAAHVQMLDSVVEILTEAGGYGEAALLLADGVWSALNEDRTDGAALLSHQLGSLAERTDDTAVQSLSKVAEAAVPWSSPR